MKMAGRRASSAKRARLLEEERQRASEKGAKATKEFLQRTQALRLWYCNRMWSTIAYKYGTSAFPA